MLLHRHDRGVTSGLKASPLDEVTPCEGINHPLGGGHPDAVLFSTHVMEEFGGREAVLRNFGGYLEAYAKFIDEHLETARLVQFDDVQEQAAVHERWILDWGAPETLRLMNDMSLSSAAVAERLGCAQTVVRNRRRAMGIKRSRNPKKFGWMDDPAVRAIVDDASLSNVKAAKLIGVSSASVAKARIMLRGKL